MACRVAGDSRFTTMNRATWLLTGSHSKTAARDRGTENGSPRGQFAIWNLESGMVRLDTRGPRPRLTPNCSLLTRRLRQRRVGNRSSYRRGVTAGDPSVEAPWPVTGLGFLQERNEGLDRQARLSDDCPQRAAVEFLVVGHDQLRERRVSSEDDVAAFLPPEKETGPLERANALATGDARQLAHTATSRASKRSGGTARWSSSSAAT